MVSGVVTSPWDQERIFSGLAREMRIESKSAIRLARSYGLLRYKVVSSLPSFHRGCDPFVWSGPAENPKELQNRVVEVGAAAADAPSQISRPLFPAASGASSIPHQGRATAARAIAR